MQSRQEEELLQDLHPIKQALQFEEELPRAVVLKYPDLHLQPYELAGSELGSLHTMHE